MLRKHFLLPFLSFFFAHYFFGNHETLPYKTIFLKEINIFIQQACIALIKRSYFKINAVLLFCSSKNLEKNIQVIYYSVIMVTLYNKVPWLT